MNVLLYHLECVSETQINMNDNNKMENVKWN